MRFKNISVDLEPPPRPLHQRKLRDISLDVASTPPVQEGRCRAKALTRGAWPREFLLAGDARSFAHCDDLIRVNVEQHIDDAAGPQNLQAIGARGVAQAKMNPEIVL